MAINNNPIAVASEEPYILGATDYSATEAEPAVKILESGDFEDGVQSCRAINMGPDVVYITHNAAKTTAKGWPLAVGEIWPFKPTVAPYARCAAGDTATLRIVQKG